MEQNVVVRGYSQKQSKAITTSMLVAAIGFVATCVLGYAFSFLWESMYGVINRLYIISGIALLATLILSIVWTFKIDSWSIGAGIGVVSLYCLAESVGFSSLFVAFNVREILIIFGLVGFILIGTYCVSRVVSAKGALTLWKVTWTLTIFYMIASLIVTLSTLFLKGISLQMMLIISFVGGLLSVLYLVYEFWSIQRIDEFVEDSEMKTKLAIFYGFQILIDIIALIWRIARLYLVMRD